IYRSQWALWGRWHSAREYKSAAIATGSFISLKTNRCWRQSLRQRPRESNPRKKQPYMPSGLTSHSKSPMTLADFTSPGMIIPQLRGQEAASVIQELGYAMQREGRVPDLLPFYHAVLNREFLASTDMEAGMALPHARLPGLKELAFAFGRSDRALLW